MLYVDNRHGIKMFLYCGILFRYVYVIWLRSFYTFVRHREHYHDVIIIKNIKIYDIVIIHYGSETEIGVDTRITET